MESHDCPSAVCPAEGLAARRRVWLACVGLVIAVTLAAYANCFWGVFTFDDQPAILDHAAIHDLAGFLAGLTPWRGGRQLGFLSFAIDYALYGPHEFGYHVTNLAIHLAAALVLFGIVRRTLSRAPLAARYGRHAPWLAAAVAGLWSVHPLQTESVTFIAQRFESLAGLFYLLTLYGFIRALDSRRRALWLAGSAASAILGTYTKETLLTVPLLLLWYDRVLVAGSWAEVFRRRKWYYLALAATWLLQFGAAHIACDAVGGAVEARTGGKVDALRYWASQPRALLYYLWLSVWPIGQCLDVGLLPSSSMLAEWPAWLPVAGLLAAELWCIVRRPVCGLVGGWLLLLLAPRFVVPSPDLVVEHRMYLPLAAVAVTIVLAGYEAARWLSVRWNLRAERAHGYLAILGGVGLLALACETFCRNAIYHSEITLWSDTVATAPNNVRARINLGAALGDRGLFTEADAQLRRAIELAPTCSEAYFNLGVIFERTRERPRAVACYEIAVRLRPEYARAHYNLANLLVDEGHYREAAAHYERVIADDPRYIKAYENLAWLLAATEPAQGGDAARAVELAEARRRLPHAGSAVGLDVLAAAYASAGRFPEAVATAQQAMQQATAENATALAAQIEQRLALYAAGRPYRLTETPTAKAEPPADSRAVPPATSTRTGIGAGPARTAKS